MSVATTRNTCTPSVRPARSLLAYREPARPLQSVYGAPSRPQTDRDIGSSASHSRCALVSNVSRSGGFHHVRTDGGRFSMMIVCGALVARLPLTFHAEAVSSNGPSAYRSVSRPKPYGADSGCGPSCRLAARSWLKPTAHTPESSDAVASSRATPETRAPSAGEVRATVGSVHSLVPKYQLSRCRCP